MMLAIVQPKFLRLNVREALNAYTWIITVTRKFLFFKISNQSWHSNETETCSRVVFIKNLYELADIAAPS